MSNPRNTDRPAKAAAAKNAVSKPVEQTSADTTETKDSYICGEVEAQLDALQEIAATSNGDVRPEITVRLRPVGTMWMGCQCGTTFVSASGKNLCEAMQNFRDALRANRK